MISSLTNQKVKDVVNLHSKKGRVQESKILVEGHHLVEESISLGLLEELYCQEDCKIDFENKVICTKEVVQKMSTTKTAQSVVGVAKMPKIDSTQSKVIILDNLQDPGNVGTIIRTAVSFGFDTIVMSEECVDWTSPKVVRSSQGAIFKVNIIVCDIIDYIKKFKGKTLATNLDKNSVNYSEINNSEPLAIVLGNEGNGVRKEVLDVVDESIIIPMSGMESLNVAIAAGIVMNHFQTK